MPAPRPALAALVALAVALPLAGAAQSPDPGWRLTTTLAGRIAPAAAGVDLTARYRRGLYADARPLLALNHAQVSGGLWVSPADARPALAVEVQPLSVLSLGLSYGADLFFGSAGQAQSYPSPRSRLGTSALGSVRPGPGGSYPLAVHQLSATAALQARVRAVGVRAAARATRFDASLHRDDRVVYDAEEDLLVYRRGWLLQADADLAWFARDGLLLGARHTLAATWYPRAAFAEGDRDGLRRLVTSRLGPVARIALWRGRGGVAGEGALLLSAQWWLDHPERAGAVPVTTLALQVAGWPG